MSVQLYKSKILGTGSYLPEGLITNEYLESIVDTNDQWITERTGIKVRHKAAPGELTSDMAAIACKNAMEMAGVTPDEIDHILFATVTPDMFMPNCACILQQKIGVKRGMAVDLSAACTGFVYGLSMADQFIKTGAANKILVVGAEILHQRVDYEDRGTCILFGDGAGAAVVGRNTDNDDADIFGHHLMADGSLGELLYMPAGGSQEPITAESIANKTDKIKMNGREIFKSAVRAMSNCSKEVLAQTNIDPENIDWVIPHQANKRIIEAVANRFGISMDKVVVEIEDMGNISSATIPVALDRAVRDGRIKRGQNLLLTAFGGGLTSGSLVMKY